MWKLGVIAVAIALCVGSGWLFSGLSHTGLVPQSVDDLVCGYLTLTSAGKRYVASVSRLFEYDDRAYIEIRYRHPDQKEGGGDYTKLETLYWFLTRMGSYGKVITRDAAGIEPEKARVVVTRRPEPVAVRSVPAGVRRVAEQFLMAWSTRDQEAVHLLSPRLRMYLGRGGPERLLSGISNPHHCGYFLHRITPLDEGWLIDVSLFEHYTGYILDLRPIDHSYLFIKRESEDFVIDRMAALRKEEHTLAQDGRTYPLSTWSIWRQKEPGFPHTSMSLFTIHVDDKLIYYFGNTHLNIEEVSDVTGDATREVIVSGGGGGNSACSQDFIILALRGDAVEVLWPIRDFIRSHGTYGKGWFKDLDEDGVPELLLYDHRFTGWGSLCMACSPCVPVIYAWEQDHYRYASPQFPEVYHNELQEIAAIEPDDILSTATSADPSALSTLFSPLIRLLLCYEHMGLKEEGWEELQRLVEKWDFEQIWDAYAQTQDESPLSTYLNSLHARFFKSAGFRVP